MLRALAVLAALVTLVLADAAPPLAADTLVVANKRMAQCLECENQYPLEEVSPEVAALEESA